MNTWGNRDSNFSDIFPAYSTASQSQFLLKSTTMREENDMIESMVSNQIELKLQQTQLEAAMTKMELLDELKMEMDELEPLGNGKPMATDDCVPRISTVINLDKLANQLHADHLFDGI